MSTIQNGDARVILSPLDAEALAGAMSAQRPTPAGISTEQRTTIERLLVEEKLARGGSMARDGSYKEFQRTRRSLRHAQDAALQAFASSLGWRPLRNMGSSFNWSIFSLRDDDYSKQWCEICGFGCERDDADHGRSFKHKNGLANGPRKELHALLIHTRHHFGRVEAFAADVRLKSAHIGWSWHGPEFTAALLTRVKS